MGTTSGHIGPAWDYESFFMETPLDYTEITFRRTCTFMIITLNGSQALVRFRRASGEFGDEEQLTNSQNVIALSTSALMIRRATFAFPPLRCFIEVYYR